MADTPSPFPEGEIAHAVVRLSQAVERTGALLEEAADLHRRLVEVHGLLTEPLVDLEHLLASEHKSPPAA